MEAILRKETTTWPKRLIGHIKGSNSGSTVVFFGGLHGNEPAGVKALSYVFKQIHRHNISLNGTLCGIRGNLKALELEKRFLEIDLNRIWENRHISSILRRDEEFLRPDEAELLHIYNSISKILLEQPPPYYFLDLHTTSSESEPFITISDAMINRKFAALFKIPIVLGLEEHLRGTLLNYINERGYVSLGFEAGQHQQEIAVENCIEFIWQTLHHTQLISTQDYHRLRNSNSSSAACKNPCFYEVTQRFHIENNEHFKMVKGFRNFHKIKKGQTLAYYRNQVIQASANAQIFMPLYQSQGKDGFFIVRKIPKSALKISAFLRRFKLYKFLILLPGISWTNKDKETLMVNKKIARFYIKSAFHLFGYRKIYTSENYYYMANREKRTKNQQYKNSVWL